MVQRFQHAKLAYSEFRFRQDAMHPARNGSAARISLV